MVIKLLSVVLLLGLLGAAPVSGQTVTEKAKAKIAQEKEKARVSEAKRLLKEKAEKEARIEKIKDRLTALDNGAEPESASEGLTIQDTTYICAYIDRVGNCR